MLTRNPGNTGEQIRDHKLATSIINLHGTQDCVFDDESLALLERFVVGRSPEKRDEILHEEDWVDEMGTRDGTKAVNRSGSLVGLLIARYGTNDPALDDRDWELLNDWMVRGMPSGQHVSR